MEYTNLPDINGLAALRAVVEKGGVADAAKKLNVGQPAISKRLRQLEECYGIKIMERISGRLNLTEAGEKVYLLAVLTLDRNHAVVEELRNLSAGFSSMRLEVTFSIGEYMLPDILLQFNEVYPSYKVETRLGYSRNIQTNLATRMADVALLEFAPDHPDILVQKWQEDELWLVCGTKHPLVETELLPVEDLSSLSYVLREPQSSIRYTMNEALERIGIVRLNIPLEVGSTETIIEILARGKHVSFLPRFVVEERVRQGSLLRIKVKGFRIMRTLWIARNRSNIDHPVVDAFIAMLREEKARQEKQGSSSKP